MKKNFKLLGLFAVALSIIFTSCKGDKGDPSPEDEKKEELSGTWNIVGASVLDEALSDISINFNAENTTYSVTGLSAFADANLNHAEVLAEAGDFSLNDNLDVVSLSPGGDFNIVNIDKESGNLELSYTASFPKADSDEQNITLSLELQ